MAESFGDSPDLNSAIAQLKQAGIDPDAFERRLKRTRAALGSETPSGPAAVSATPAAISAATRGCFLPSDLGFAADADSANDPELARLLAHSDVVTVGSQRAWQLKPDARRSVLLQAREDGSLAAAREPAHPVHQERDGEGALLRSALAGETPDPETMPLPELEQLTTVSEWLGDTGLAKLPPAAELRQKLQQRELLEPFRLLVGRPVAAGPDATQDRVVGRRKEIEALRAYVGIVPPEELQHYVTRAFSSLWSTVTFSDANTEPLLLQGIGGMGKSTLLAKFILDHALYPGVTLPFVYLDFDRATLAPRQPLQLLIEIALQLGLWFPAMEPPLKDLRFKLRAAIDGQTDGSPTTSSTALQTYCGQLRSLVEGVNKTSAPVVLLFDTFEVVQYDDAAVRGVTSLIAVLRGPKSDRWDNLRMVVAGRAEMPEIETSHEPIVLGPLSAAETETLIKRRNELDEVALTPKQIKALAQPLRNSPLDVAIVMTWLKDQEPAERAKLADQIVVEVEADRAADRAAQTGPLATQRITGILINRMVNHINDPQVQKLAIPGLVVRAVTPKVIREVMAPASGLVRTPDELPAGAEDELFRRLERERWLVTRMGKAVRHRPEVRLAMLDLMRRQDEKRFAETNSLAIDFFLRDADTDPEARAETIYHLLLGAGPNPRHVLQEVEALWRSDVATFLVNAVDDLDGVAQHYLKAKLGHSVPIEVLSALPPEVVLNILRSSGARMLRTAPVEIAALLKVSPAIDDDPSVLGLKTEALFRAGQWNALRELTWRASPTSKAIPATGTSRLAEILSCVSKSDFARMRVLDKEAGSPLRFLLRWGARDPSSGNLWTALFMLASLGRDAADALREDDLYWHLAVLAACVDGRRPTASGPSGLVGDVAGRCRSEKRLPAVANESGALRVLAFFEDRTRPAIIRRIDFKSHFATISWPEVKQFDDFLSTARFASDFVGGEKDARLRRVAAVKRGRAFFPRLADHPPDTIIADVSDTREFAAVIEDLVEVGSPEIDRGVLRLIATTHPDWVEPLGHALTAAFGGKVPDRLGWWSSIKFFGGRQRSEATTDGHEIMARADEAGRLPEAVGDYAKLVEKQAGPEGRDFLELARAFGAWRDMLQKAADPKAKEA